MGHVFISYNHIEDSDFAEILISRIEKEGLATWIDTNKLSAGQEWRSNIDQAIKEAFALIVIMSPSAKASEYVTYEWAFAWGAGVRIIPVLHKPTPLHPRLESLQYLDFSSHSYRPWDKLLRVVKDAAEEYAYLAHAQHETLYELLPLCTVKIEYGRSKSTGTGFFVAPNLILTCAHIFGTDGASEVEVQWNEQTYLAQIWKNLGEVLDLALLKVDVSDHPIVYLFDGAIPSDTFYSFGYPDIRSDGDVSTFEFEGRSGKHGALLKFKSGQVRPGMSGAPLLNVRTGAVCGCISITRDRTSLMGGLGIPTKTILQNILELNDLQQQFHQQNARWISCLTPEQRRLVVLPKNG